MNWFNEISGALFLVFLAWAAWRLLGLAAKRLGTGRLQVIGLAALIAAIFSR